MTSSEYCSALLGSILEKFGCHTGTIHQVANDPTTLSLVCQIGVPDFLIEKIASIPFGKGIAGAAAERKEPVELCNLQEDLGGIARVDARKTGVAGSLAVPILSTTSNEVIGTLGIGKIEPYEFTEPEKQRLMDYASELAGHFEHKQ